jgi:hypothetical protein
LVAARSYSQEVEASSQWDKFDRLRGRLEYRFAVPEGKHPKYSVEHSKALSKVSMESFERTEGATCCAGLSPVESVVTKRDGKFEFIKAKPGKYFLVAHWKGNSPLRAITVTGEKTPPRVCSEQGVDIDQKAKLQKFITITVD